MAPLVLHCSSCDEPLQWVRDDELLSVAPCYHCLKESREEGMILGVEEGKERSSLDRFYLQTR